MERKEKEKLDYYCVGFSFVRKTAVVLYVGCMVVLHLDNLVPFRP